MLEMHKMSKYCCGHWLRPLHVWRKWRGKNIFGKNSGHHFWPPWIFLSCALVSMPDRIGGSSRQVPITGRASAASATGSRPSTCRASTTFASTTSSRSSSRTTRRCWSTNPSRTSDHPLSWRCIRWDGSSIRRWEQPMRQKLLLKSKKILGQYVSRV